MEVNHKCYISFKTEDEGYKKEIQRLAEKGKISMIDKSLNEPIDSENEDYIMRKIREDYLSDSTVTIFLIGEYSSEILGKDEQEFIKRELQASLYNGSFNTRNGILGVVLPNMYDKIYFGKHICGICGGTHNIVNLTDKTVVKEFSRNYFLNINREKECAYSEDDRYCVLVKWDDFIKDPNSYIEKAFRKRYESIAKKVVVYPK